MTASGVADFIEDTTTFGLFFNEISAGSYDGSIKNSFTDFELLGAAARGAGGGLVKEIGGSGGVSGTAEVENCYTRGNMPYVNSGIRLSGIANVVGNARIENVYSTVLIDPTGATTPGGLFSQVSTGMATNVLGTNYFVDGAGSNEGFGFGSCEPTATCVRGTNDPSTAASDADALAEIRALSVLPADWSPDDWDLRGPTQVPALKYNGGPDVCGNLCGQLIPNQRD